MPFPLAHPAAVLPLRRYCPRYLSFPALVVGSLCPDVGYLLSRYNVEMYSHRWVGSFTFCLPVGLLILGAIYLFRWPVIGLLSERRRRMFLPLCQSRIPSLLVIVVSLLLGTWTHLLWDSFTHPHGWLVEHLVILQAPLLHWDDHTLRVHNLVWYICSFGGVICVCYAYYHWVGNFQPPDSASRSNGLRQAIVFATLMLPIALVHHLVHGMVGMLLVGLLCGGLVIGAAFGIGPEPVKN